MKAKWPFEEMLPQEFEELVICLCQKILGTGTIHFSTGPDGGRDALFNGTAENFPSASNPWHGRFIIQAKHTEKPLASCSDADFNRILKDEIPKLQNLIEQKEVDYYLLFTNRKLSGNQNAKISDFIDSHLKVETRLLGYENINLWLNQNKNIVKTLGLNRLLLPFEFYENDLKELILKFAAMKDDIGHEIKRKTSRWSFSEKTEKNRLNNLGEHYFKFMQKKSLSHFDKIDKFLRASINAKYEEYYENTIDDLQEIILVKRDEYGQFEELLNIIYKYILENNIADLKLNRGLIRVFLHYMYWNCDIGISENKK